MLPRLRKLFLLQGSYRAVFLPLEQSIPAVHFLIRFINKVREKRLHEVFAKDGLGIYYLQDHFFRDLITESVFDGLDICPGLVSADERNIAKAIPLTLVIDHQFIIVGKRNFYAAFFYDSQRITGGPS